MTTVFDEMAGRSAWPSLAAAFGRTATYTPGGGTAVNCTVVLTDIASEIDELDDSRHAQQTMTASVAAEDVAEPAVGDSLTIDEFGTFVVETVLEQTAARSKLRCRRQARQYVATPGSTMQTP